MQVAVNESGEIVIPKEVAEAAGFAPGMEVELTANEGHVEAESAFMEVRFEREGPFLFPVACKPGPVLTAEMVEETRRAILEERYERFVHGND